MLPAGYLYAFCRMWWIKVALSQLYAKNSALRPAKTCSPLQKALLGPVATRAGRRGRFRAKSNGYCFEARVTATSSRNNRQLDPKGHTSADVWRNNNVERDPVVHELVQPVVRRNPVTRQGDVNADHCLVDLWVAMRARGEEPWVRRHDRAKSLGVALERGQERCEFAVRRVGADHKLASVIPRLQADALVPRGRGGVVHNRHRQGVVSVGCGQTKMFKL